VLHSLDGSIRYVRDTASPVRAEGGIVSGWVIALHDVSASVLGEMEARQRAEQDALTGLANRFRFEREASLALQVAQQQGIESCVAIIDLDSFKAVNDAAGHASGDEILRRTAGAIQSVLPPESLVARMGGDEFAVLMRQCGEAEALLLGRRIVQSILAIRILHDGADYGVGASVGIAQARAEMAGLPAWIGAADDACYRAKRAGRGQCLA
jgi:diguanylate cyclase (GGDEF)-like protein